MNKQKILKFAKGMRDRTNCFRIARPRVEKALQHAYVSRKTKKRDFRSLSIQQINAATRLYGINYSQFISGTVYANIALNRKVLADLAQTEPYSFRAVVGTVNEFNHLRSNNCSKT